MKLLQRPGTRLCCFADVYGAMIRICLFINGLLHLACTAPPVSLVLFSSSLKNLRLFSYFLWCFLLLVLSVNAVVCLDFS